MANDTIKQIADNLGVTTINGNYLSGIADYYGVDLTTSDDLMADILTAVGGNPATSTDYLQDIVLTLGGTVTINGNWMEAWEAITAVPPAPVNSTLPVISGTTTLGSVLTTTNGTWTNSPSSFTYQWKRGATNIGTNTTTYTLVTADSGAAITCVVTAINAAGSTPATSNTITAQTYSSPVNTVAPVISGSTTVGSVLSSTTGTWNGNPSPTYAYQWKSGATNIGTNSSTYTLVIADSTAAITCVVTATNALGSANSTSNTITADNYTPVNTVAPVISGSTTVGSVLTSTDGTWTNSPTSFTYQWYRGLAQIFGETSSTYTLVYADSTAAITCVVTAINAVGSTPATSNIITADNYTPVNTVAPVISGSTPVGSTLTTTSGTWTNSPTFAYQWYRGATLITSATAATYVTVTADTGLAVTCRVTGTNPVGSAVGISNAITPTAVVAPFAFTANTNNTSAGSSTATQFKLPLTTSTGLNIVVDWGDATTSTITNHLDAAVTHTYASAGTYSISITGTLPGWQFNNTGDKLKILNIASYGVLNITTNAAFYGCTNLISNATDAPTITTTDLTNTFRSCTNFNNNIGSWSVSAVTNMNTMFFTASAFNNGGSSSIGSWNTGAVTTMATMFASAGNFNQNIGSWNTGLVTNMTSMFNGCSAFNQNISSWNTGAVTTMASMFASAGNFNQPIGTWNTALVTNMTSMFYNATAFNQNIGSWNTGAVTTMATMFNNATAFNQPLSFNTGLVTNMSSMFQGATAFDQNLGALNVANVTNFTNFMLGKTNLTFSTTNLDAIYNGWVTVQSSRTISFGTAKYSAAGVAGRAYLTGTKLWTITDGGL